MARRARRSKSKFRWRPRWPFSRASLRQPAAILAALLAIIILSLVISEFYKNHRRADSKSKLTKSNTTKPERIELASNDPEIEVLLTALDGAAQVPFSNKSGWIARDADGRELARTSSPAAAMMNISAGGQLLLRGGETGSAFIVIAPFGDEPTQAGKNYYYGKLQFKAAGRGLRVVNQIALEQYLTSVVGSEMYASSTPAAALEAQAIAARTYARYAIEELGRRPLPDSQEAQAYYGVSRETLATRAAVVATRSQILTFDGDTLPAFYHSTCGGRTVDGSVLIGSKAPAPLRGGECGFCENGKLYRWNVNVTNKTLAAVCASFNLGRQCLKIEPRGAAEEIWSSIYLATNAGSSTVTSRQFRSAILKFSPTPAIPSPFITEIAAGRDGITVRGRGFGHGVGLCQIGAAEMGRRGFTAAQILQKYYPGATVKTTHDGREVVLR